ncbi:hypothetical protein Trydic_g7471 [Trypoxylus dichotomus]
MVVHRRNRQATISQNQRPPELVRLGETKRSRSAQNAWEDHRIGLNNAAIISKVDNTQKGICWKQHINSEVKYIPKKAKLINSRKLPQKRKKGLDYNSDENWGKKKGSGVVMVKV